MRIACLALALGLAGCGAARVAGTVHEKVLVAPADPIAVIWTTGSFSNPQLVAALTKAGVYAIPYTACTNAMIERTFRANGYDARPLRAWPGVRPDLPRDARYVLTLSNTAVRSPQLRNAAGTYDLFGDLQLTMQADLYEARTRRKLWSAPAAWLVADAKANAIPLVQLLRGLAADGYLAVPAEGIADHTGARGRSDSEIEQRCP